MTSDSFRTALNDEQYAAVTAPDGPVLVLAAAGTGKTRTLVYRVGHLTQSGVDPQRILLLTFTNKAAREMLSRAEELIGPGVSGVLGGTFHHLANRILRRYGPHIGLDSSYVILDREDSKKLVSNCVKECGKLPKEFPRANVLLGLFGEVANTATPIQDVVADRFDDFDVDEDVVIKIHGDYVARKHAMSAVDFDDMLVRCLQLLKEQPRVLERYQQQFIHVLVDEYQDTNVIQAEMVDLLAAGRRNLMVVGDDFQSIYSWRGAAQRLHQRDRHRDAHEQDRKRDDQQDDLNRSQIALQQH